MAGSKLYIIEYSNEYSVRNHASCDTEKDTLIFVTDLRQSERNVTGIWELDFDKNEMFKMRLAVDNFEIHLQYDN